MSAILTIVVIKFLNVIYDKQIRAIVECHNTNWAELELGKIILFSHTTKVNFVYATKVVV